MVRLRALRAQISRCCLRASHTPKITWAAPRILMRSGSSTNHIPILRVLSGPTTHSRECFSGARNSMSPSPTVIIAKTSMSLLFHTGLFSSFSCAPRKACRVHFRLRGAGFPSAMYTPKLRGAPHGYQGQDTEAHKRYSSHKWQGSATCVGQLRRHARRSSSRWARGCGCRWACGCGCRWARGWARRGARRGSSHLAASGHRNACRHLGMDRALISVSLARIIFLEREGVSVTRLSGGRVKLLSVRRSYGMGRLSFVDPRNRRPRSNAKLIGIKEEILDRNRHLILCRGGGSRDQHGCHREYGQIQ